MSGSEDLNTADASEVSDIRFGLRGLLLLTTAIAVGSGVLGTVYRGFNADARVVAATSWSLCAVIVIVWLGYCVTTRIRLARIAGNTLYLLSPQGTFGAARRSWATVLIGLFWIGHGLYVMG